ncbi:unnamed protein product [Paramecium octaurelia]|uniref:Uncharacterized protein n=1 Tax=Paramecium octaurelia TaxID=43137 RepID=A0A8S1W365_PAROT|nr:unnamed protein product [Paramecium octaurelia]
MGCSVAKSTSNELTKQQQHQQLREPEIQDQSHVIIPKSTSKNIPLFVQPNSCRRTSDNLVRFKTEIDSKENLLSIKKNPIYLRRASSKTQADQSHDIQAKE